MEPVPTIFFNLGEKLEIPVPRVQFLLHKGTIAGFDSGLH